MNITEYIIKLKTIEMILRLVFSEYKLSDRHFTILLLMDYVQNTMGHDSVRISRIRFLLKLIYGGRQKNVQPTMDLLHEKGYIWIIDAKTATLTSSGKYMIDKIYSKFSKVDQGYLSTFVSGIYGSKSNKPPEIKVLSGRDARRYIGVKWNKGKYKAVVVINKKHHVIGEFNSPLEAAVYRDKYIKENNLKYCRKSITRNDERI